MLKVAYRALNITGICQHTQCVIIYHFITMGTGCWILQESVNTLSELLFIILLLWVSVREVPFWFIFLPYPLYYFFELKFVKRAIIWDASAGNFNLILMIKVLLFQAARFFYFFLLWILSPWFEKSKHLYKTLMDCNLQVCSPCYNFLKLSNKLLC